MGAVWINVGEGSLQEGIDVSLDVRHGHTVHDGVGDALVEAQDLEVRGRGSPYLLSILRVLCLELGKHRVEGLDQGMRVLCP